LVAAWAAAKAPGKRAAAPAAVVDASIVGAPETAPEQPVQRAEASPGTQGVRGTGKRTSSATATA
jgi:hypothetical protein